MLKVRPDTESGGREGGGGVCSSLQVRYDKLGGRGGMQPASGPTRKLGGGGGGGEGGSSPQVRYEKRGLCLAHSKYVMLIINGCSFGRGGCSSTRSTPPGYTTARAALLCCKNVACTAFYVNTTCHNIPLGGSDSSVTLRYRSTFRQSDSGVIPIPTPFRCFNGS